MTDLRFSNLVADILDDEQNAYQLQQIVGVEKAEEACKKLQKMIDSGKFRNDTKQGRYAWAKKVAQNSERKEPETKEERDWQRVKEWNDNMFSEILDRAGPQFISVATDIIELMKQARPKEYDAIIQYARTSSWYLLRFDRNKWSENIDERREVNKIGYKRSGMKSLSDEEKKLWDRFRAGMDEIDAQAETEAVCCMIYCMYGHSIMGMNDCANDLRAILDCGSGEPDPEPLSYESEHAAEDPWYAEL